MKFREPTNSRQFKVFGKTGETKKLEERRNPKILIKSEIPKKSKKVGTDLNNSKKLVFKI